MKSNDSFQLSNNQLILLSFSVLIVALCGIAYELAIASVSTVIQGDSVYQFSLTIGFFMFAMGLGSYISKWIHLKLIERFILIEVLISLFGGLTSVILFLTFPFPSFYIIIKYGLIIIIGTLVGLEIPILTRILSAKQELKDSIANVLSLDYIGALIGSVTFPIFLLPALGYFRCTFGFGILNIGVALINVIIFRDVLRHKNIWLIATILIAGLMTGGVIWGSFIGTYAEGLFYSDDIYYKKQTIFQRIVVTKNQRTGHFRLYLDGHIQFSELDEYRYHEGLVHPVMSIPGPKTKILILGGGDGMAAREVLKYQEVEAIHLVDIDPEMTRICSEFPPIVEINENALKHPKLTIYNEDGKNFIGSKKNEYDRIIIDFPDPHNEVLTTLYTVEFYKMVRRALKPNGYVVTQSSSPFITRRVYWCISNSLEKAGFSVLNYHIHLPSFGLWGYNLGSKNGELPDKFQFNVETKFITSEVMQASQIFGKDVAKVDVPPNSIHSPNIYILYSEDVKGGQ